MHNTNSKSKKGKYNLDLNKINHRTIHELRRRGHSNDAIAEMTPDTAFAEYCAYFGIFNPAKGPTKILDNLRSAVIGAVSIAATQN